MPCQQPQSFIDTYTLPSPLSNLTHCAGYMALVCAPGLVIASRLYAMYKQGGGLPLPSPAKTFTAMVGVLLPRNLQAAVYSVLTLAFTGMAALCLSAAPGEPMRLYQGLHGEVLMQ